VPKFNAKHYAASKANGYRSGLEELVQSDLIQANVDALYESIKIEWEDLTYRRYTPDFLLPNGIIVETKGLFTTEDRRKHTLVKKQHPMLDIRFVFQSSKRRISKTSKTTYAGWCEKQGFLYADKTIPESWIKEPKKKDMPLEFNPFKGTKHE
jgi:hypothetical protein